MIYSFGIRGVHIDNGTEYRNSTVIFLAIYNYFFRLDLS